jgi:hypothetical protein
MKGAHGGKKENDETMTRDTLADLLLALSSGTIARRNDSQNDVYTDTDSQGETRPSPCHSCVNDGPV